MVPVLKVIIKKAKNEIKCKFIPVHAVKVWGSLGVAPLILNFGFR
jgi:hypothetical protein